MDPFSAFLVLFSCVALFIIAGIGLAIFSALFGRRRWGYGMYRPRPLFPWFWGEGRSSSVSFMSHGTISTTNTNTTIITIAGSAAVAITMAGSAAVAIINSINKHNG